MTWTYTGNPADSDKDAVRWLVGDTDTNNQLVQDEEINYALSRQPTVELAAAMVLRTLAAKFSGDSFQIGDVEVEGLSESYLALANDLDPGGATVGTLLASPVFGGQDKAKNRALDEDTNKVQPSFKIGADDIPGGPANRSYDLNYTDDC